MYINAAVDCSGVSGKLPLVEVGVINAAKSKYKCHLGPEFYNRHLTKREIDCIYYLLRGQTAKGTGVILGLSQRTIESYIENVKDKLQCTTKPELIEKIFNSPFLQQLRFILQYGKKER